MTVDFGGNRNSTYTTLIVGDFNRAVAAAGIYVIPVGIFRVRFGFGFFGACHPEHTGIDFFDLCIFCHCTADRFKGYAFGCLRVIKRTTGDGTYGTLVIKVVERSARDRGNGTLVAKTDLAAFLADGCIGNQIDHASAFDINNHFSRIGHNQAIRERHMAFFNQNSRVILLTHHGTGTLERQIKVVRHQTDNVRALDSVHMIVELRIQRHIQPCIIALIVAIVSAAVIPCSAGSHYVVIQNSNE